MKNVGKIIISVLVMTLLLTAGLFSDGAVVARAQSQPVTYIKTAEELKNAIVRKQATIFVDDITFDTAETIVLNYNVRIVGKSEKSVIKNLCIKVVGSQTFENKRKIALENIKFDGCFDKTKFDLTKEKTFSEVFGTEKAKTFLTNDMLQTYMGYYDIDIRNCEITNYFAEAGAVLDFRDDKSENGEKVIRIKDSKIYNNVGAEKIVNISNRKIKLIVENSEMYDNYAISKIANLSNVAVSIDGLNVHDNNFMPLNSAEYSTQENSMYMIRGGGLYFGNCQGLVKNMTVEKNQTYYGGGMFVALAKQGDNELVFADCVFRNNQAKINGGAVGVESYVGYPVYFINCQFVGNTAPKGGSICATPFARDRADGNTSYIEFSFCNFSGNVAGDDKALAYYLDGYTKTKTDGKIVVKACRIEDATFLTGNGEKENDYNIVSSTAITDKNDIKVPCQDYVLWANGFYKGETQPRQVGYDLTTASSKNVFPLQPVLYGVCTIGCVVIALLYLLKSTEKHLEMVLITIAVAVINVGYFLFSISGDIVGALLFNNLAYLGNAFLPLFFMMAVANVCRYRVKKPSKIILSAITVVNFLFTTTVWFSNWFYNSPTYAIINGAVDIVKQNGFLHTIYVAYVFAYFCVIFGIVLYSLVKNKLEHKKYGILIFSAELVCLLVWTVEMFVPINYELLSVAYLLTSLLLAVLFFEMEKFGILAISHIIDAPKPECESADGAKRTFAPQDIEVICNTLVNKNILSRRETEILALLLQGKSATAISEILFVSKNTVKSHTANIYKKLSVKTRDELRYRVISELQG